MKKQFLSLALILVLLVIPLSAVYAQDGEQLFTVQVDGIFVYSEPNPISSLIAVMSIGSTLTILPDAAVNGFNKVRIPDGREGWAKLNTPGTPEAAVVQPDGTVSASPTGILVQVFENVRIRNAPSLSAPKIGDIGWGEVAEFLGTDPSGDWYYINYKGLIGWSFGIFFKPVNVAVLPAVNVAGGADGQGGGGSLVVRSIDNVRIRIAPSLTATQIGDIGWGEQATLLGFSNDGNWININYKGLVGWSFGSFFQVINAGPEAIPVVSIDNTTVVPVPVGGDTSISEGVGGGGSGALTVVARDNVNIRSTPSLSGLEIGDIGWGEAAPVLDISADGDWYKINYKGLIGWVFGIFFDVSTANVTIPSTEVDNAADLVGSVVFTGDVPAWGGVQVRSKDNVNIRIDRDLSAAKIGGVAWGEVVNVHAVSPQGNWFLINSNGTIGWVAANFFEYVAGDPGSLPVR